MTEKQVIAVGRMFVAGILIMTFLISLFTTRSIFKLGIWSFTGFASLFPVVAAALFWRRSTAVGAIAAVATVVSLWLYFFWRGWGNPGYSVLDSGVMSVTVIFAASSLALVVGSLLSRPPEREIVETYVS